MVFLIHSKLRSAQSCWALLPKQIKANLRHPVGALRWVLLRGDYGLPIDSIYLAMHSWMRAKLHV